MSDCDNPNLLSMTEPMHKLLEHIHSNAPRDAALGREIVKQMNERHREDALLRTCSAGERVLYGKLKEVLQRLEAVEALVTPIPYEDPPTSWFDEAPEPETDPFITATRAVSD